MGTIKPTRFQGIYESKGVYLTKNLTPKTTVYTEKLICQGGVEYRTWDPKKSKLCAGLKKGLSQIGIKNGNVVLYLGAASGTTASHVSDIVGENGFVFALDFAPRVIRDLIFVCEKRKNIAPIIADASHPDNYKSFLCEVDCVFQDIAQRNQAEIFISNCRMFLKENGFGVLALKARSIDITKKPKEIFRKIREQLEQEMIIVDYKDLYPYEKDHCIFVVKNKN